MELINNTSGHLNYYESNTPVKQMKWAKTGIPTGRLTPPVVITFSAHRRKATEPIEIYDDGQDLYFRTSKGQIYKAGKESILLDMGVMSCRIATVMFNYNYIVTFERTSSNCWEMETLPPPVDGLGSARWTRRATPIAF